MDDQHNRPVMPNAAARRAPARRGRPASRPLEEVGNRTLSKGLELLATFARMDGPASLTEIAAAAGMPVTRTSRYVASLASRGFLLKDPATGRYELGPAVIELGLRAIGRIDGVRLATDLMMNLTESTGLVSILCVWGSEGPTVIRWEQGRLDSGVKVREGITLSLLRSAAGKVFLAYMPRDVTASHLKREMNAWNRAAGAAGRITMAEIERICAEVRARGLARAVGEQNPALAAISAPVFSADGTLAMSLTIISARGTFDTSLDGEPAARLDSLAQELSRRLGYTGGWPRPADAP